MQQIGVNIFQFVELKILIYVKYSCQRDNILTTKILTVQILWIIITNSGGEICRLFNLIEIMQKL